MDFKLSCAGQRLCSECNSRFPGAPADQPHGAEEMNYKKEKIMVKRIENAKPCPFCGNENIFIVIDEEEIEVIGSSSRFFITLPPYIYCCSQHGGCGASIPVHSKSENDLLLFWNRRSDQLPASSPEAENARAWHALMETQIPERCQFFRAGCDYEECNGADCEIYVPACLVEEIRAEQGTLPSECPSRDTTQRVSQTSETARDTAQCVSQGDKSCKTV